MTFCKSVCPWAIKQAKQVSTWRGLAILGAAAGVIGSPEQANVLIGAVASIFGLTDVIRDDSRK